VVVSNSATICRTAPAPQVFKWKAVWGWPKVLTVRPTTQVVWDQIVAKSNGRIQIEYIEPGTLMPNEAILNAVGTGSVDVGMAFATWFTETPEQLGQVLNGLPMAWTTPEDALSLYYDHGLLKFLRDKVYSPLNAFMLPGSITGPYSLSTSFPLTKMEDIKGKKIRTNTTYAPFISAWGGVPTTIPGEELYMALKLGTVDGQVWGLSGFSSGQNLGEVLSWAVLPAFSFPPVAPNWISLKSWNALPDDLKGMIEDVVKKNFITSANNEKVSSDKDMAAAKMNIYRMTDAEYKKSQEIARSLWDKKAKDGPLSLEAVGILKSYYGMK